MSPLLPSEILSLKYDAPHQRGMTEDEDFWIEEKLELLVFSNRS